LKQIAAKTGLSTAAVSMALRRHPNIPAITVARVDRIAAAIGYRPDPEIARLMARLRQGRVRRPAGTLALINLYPSTTVAAHNHQLARIVKGIRERAESQGYAIDEFALGSSGLSPGRLANVLAARGIEGLILPGSPQFIDRLEFPFERFASALIGSSIELPLHRGSPHQYLDMLTVLEQIRLKAYRAPALLLRSDTDRRVRHQHSAAFVWAQGQVKAWRKIPVTKSDEITEEMFARWMKRHRPDVVLAQSPRIQCYLDWFARLGMKVPEDVGFVSLDIDPSEALVSGMLESKEDCAAAAVDLVIAQLHRGERGYVARPKKVLLQGEWREGFSTRKSQTRDEEDPLTL